MVSADGKFFSVVLLHFNQGDYWPTAIESILSQNYPNIEIVFADDGTPDFNADDVKRYVEQRRQQGVTLRFSIHEQNQGTFANFYDADKLCTGDYVLHFAADDALASTDILSKLADRIDRESDDVCGVFGSLRYCDADLVPTSQDESLYSLEYMQEFDQMSAREQFAVAATCNKGIFPMGACAFRKSSYDKTTPVPEAGTYLIEDWPYQINATYSGYRFRFLGEDVLLYRAGGASRGVGMSISRSQKQAYADHAHCYETAIYTRDVENILSQEQMATSLRWYATMRDLANPWLSYETPELFLVSYLDFDMFVRIVGLARDLAQSYDGYPLSEAIDLSFDMVFALCEEDRVKAMDALRDAFGPEAFNDGLVRQLKQRGIEAMQRKALSEESAVLKATMASQRDEIAAMRASRTWKVGRAVLALPIALKKLIRKNNDK